MCGLLHDALVPMLGVGVFNRLVRESLRLCPKRANGENVEPVEGGGEAYEVISSN